MRLDGAPQGVEGAGFVVLVEALHHLSAQAEHKLVSVIDVVGFPDVLAAHERYYRFVLAAALTGKRDGLTPLQAAERCELGEFADWPDSERLVLNLHREYADDVGGDVDLMAALADAVTFNGGPLHCAV